MNGDMINLAVVMVSIVLAVHLIWHDRGHRP
jgi:hypothetical protein